MNLLTENIKELTRQICNEIAAMPPKEALATLNDVRSALHQISPLRAEPIDLVLWVPSETVYGNDYNPNNVAPPEMRLLTHSILCDGYTQPIVTDVREKGREIIDGFHRSRVGKESRAIRERTLGFLPVTTIKEDRESISDRMAATIRHNRARGVHGVLPMTDIVASMLRTGMTDEEVAKALGMEADEVLRFKQNTGLPELFKSSEYSQAWEGLE